MNIQTAASLAGWPTPMAGTPARNGNNEAGNNDSSRKTVALAGWPTATARDWKSSASNKHGENARPLNEVARLSGWATPKTTMGDYQTDRTGAICLNLAGQAKLSGWRSPNTVDAAGGTRTGKGQVQLCHQVKALGPARLLANGQVLTGSDAQMAAGGQLNPAHSRWLMGLPVAWDCCGATAMQYARRSRPRSSKA